MVSPAGAAEFFGFAGGFAGIGAIGAALIKSRSGKGKARADAARMLAVGYGSLADRLAKERDCLDKDNARLRKAITRIINAQTQPPCEHCRNVAAAIRLAATTVIETSEHC